MGHVALYRQFRPVTFDEVVEQKHAVTALRQSVISGQIGHAYLFCGTRGTGKTSIAKIFSRAINCLSPSNGNPCNTCEICRGIMDGTLMDVIEMDAASNNSVDNIRRICDEVMFLPSRAKYKVYIIDEVHMLSGGAFNALLKTLEEPPAHAVFILATTEPHRIPATIISRCQRYDFRRIPLESMIVRLKEIADAQNVLIDHDALVTISNLSDGALRDGISLLDQVSTGVSRKITRDDVLRITGVVDDSFLHSMAQALLTNDAPSIIALTDQLVMDGRDMIRFTLDLAHYFRDLMVIRVTPDPESLVQATTVSMNRMRDLAVNTPADTLIYAITRLSGLISELKWSPDMRTSFEIALLSFGADESSQRISERKPAALPNPTNESALRTVSAPAPAAVPVSAVVPPPAVVLAPAVVPAPAVATELPPTPDAAFEFHESSSVAQAERSRTYMAPPPIEEMFSSVPSSFAPASISTEIPVESAVVTTAKESSTDLSPMEASLMPPPEEEFCLTPPPFDEPVPEISSSPLPEKPITQPPLALSLTLAEKWAALLLKWEDTFFSDVLLLKQASVYEKNDIFYIVFPDHMKANAHNLTVRPEYSKITKDILAVFIECSSVITQIESEKDGLHADSNVPTAASSPAQPEWVAQMLAFSEATGIPVETLDNL